jgi:uncharacterized integral membrane protein (TIGR00697 family)
MKNQTREQSHLFKLIILAGLFIAGVTVANIVATKIISLGPWNVPGGIFVFVLTFMCSDVIAEVWGKPTAKKVIWAGFIANIIMALYIRLIIWFPAAPFFPFNEEFATIMGANYRIVLGGLGAYLVSQFLDLHIFMYIRGKTGVKHLWLRNTASALISQCVDSFIFLNLAFLGIMPFNVIVSMWIPTVLVKWLICVADTPFCYLGVWWARKTEPQDESKDTVG